MDCSDPPAYQNAIFAVGENQKDFLSIRSVLVKYSDKQLWENN